MRLKKDFDDYSLSNKRPEVRTKLALNIMSTSSFPGLPIYTRTVDDMRVVISKFPKRIRALVLHNKFVVNPHLIGVLNIDFFNLIHTCKR